MVWYGMVWKEQPSKEVLAAMRYYLVLDSALQLQLGCV